MSNGSTSSWQTFAIALGTLVVIALTVVAAFFLATHQEAEPTPTSTRAAAIRPTATASPTAVVPLPTFTAPLPAVTSTPIPPTATATETPSPSPPPVSPTVIVVTATPLPAVTATPDTAGGACQPPADWVAYTVQAGDTFNSLATRTETSVYELQQYNCVTAIRPGDQLYLPFIPPTPTYTPIPTGTRRPGPTPSRTPTPIRPQIDSVSPDRVDRETADQPVSITVLGKNFQPRETGFRVELKGPQTVQLELGSNRSDTSFEAVVPSGLPEGTYDLVVINANDRTGVRANAYTIGPPSPTATASSPPDITRFTPASGKISEEIELSVQGRNFRPTESGFKVELQAVQGGFNVELDLGDIRTATNFEAIIRPNTLETGYYNLIVTNPDNQIDIASSEYLAIE